MAWHWVYLIAWAGCHTIYLITETLTRKSREKLTARFDSKLYKLLCVFIVFNAVCFSNIFFRADSIDTAFQLIYNTFNNFIPTNFLSDFIAPVAVGAHQMDEFNFYITILLFLIFLIFERSINKIAVSEKLNVSYIISCLGLIMLFGIFNSGTRFIYMQF